MEKNIEYEKYTIQWYEVGNVYHIDTSSADTIIQTLITGYEED